MTRENKIQLRRALECALEDDIERHQKDRTNFVEKGQRVYDGLSILGEEIEEVGLNSKDYFY